MSDSEPATIVLAAIRRPKLLRGCRTAFIRQDDAVVTLWNVIVTFGNIVMGLLPACMVLISKVLFAVIEGSFKL